MAELRGTFAASVTPLREGGTRIDEGAVGPLVDFLAASGLDGLLVLGTTGEGMLLSQAERRRVAERFLAAADGRLSVIVHCGAQTTSDTVALGAHAAETGAAGVAVIGPPYFELDDRALHEHFRAAATACAPLPFFVYVAARSGYAVPLALLAELREEAPNLAGLKVSDASWERFEPYLIDGLDVFVGPEALIPRGLEGGAVGAVSGLAAAFPEAVARVVAAPSAEGGAELARLRDSVQRFPFHAALKFVLGRRGVSIEEDVRRPLRALVPDERRELAVLVEQYVDTHR